MLLRQHSLFVVTDVWNTNYSTLNKMCNVRICLSGVQLFKYDLWNRQGKMVNRC